MCVCVCVYLSLSLSLSLALSLPPSLHPPPQPPSLKLCQHTLTLYVLVHLQVLGDNVHNQYVYCGWQHCMSGLYCILVIITVFQLFILL